METLRRYLFGLLCQLKSGFFDENQLSFLLTHSYANYLSGCLDYAINLTFSKNPYISSCSLRTPNVTSFSCFQAQFEFALTAVAEEVNAILQALAK